MKTVIAVAALVIAIGLPISPVAAEDQVKHGGMQASATGVPSMVDGVVKKVDKGSGKVTIAHEPMANFNMPAMTMSFLVKNAAWLDQMKEGDTIRFMADKVNGAFTVVHFEQAKH
jgi:Cu/Ag efflux protein CusF